MIFRGQVSYLPVSAKKLFRFRGYISGIEPVPTEVFWNTTVKQRRSDLYIRQELNVALKPTERYCS